MAQDPLPSEEADNPVNRAPLSDPGGRTVPASHEGHDIVEAEHRSYFWPEVDGLLTHEFSREELGQIANRINRAVTATGPMAVLGDDAQAGGGLASGQPTGRSGASSPAPPADPTASPAPPAAGSRVAPIRRAPAGRPQSQLFDPPPESSVDDSRLEVGSLFDPVIDGSTPADARGQAHLANDDVAVASARLVSPFDSPGPSVRSLFSPVLAPPVGDPRHAPVRVVLDPDNAPPTVTMPSAAVTLEGSDGPDTPERSAAPTLLTHSTVVDPGTGAPLGSSFRYPSADDGPGGRTAGGFLYLEEDHSPSQATAQPPPGDPRSKAFDRVGQLFDRQGATLAAAAVALVMAAGGWLAFEQLGRGDAAIATGVSTPPPSTEVVAAPSASQGGSSASGAGGATTPPTSGAATSATSAFSGASAADPSTTTASTSLRTTTSSRVGGSETSAGQVTTSETTTVSLGQTDSSPVFTLPTTTTTTTAASTTTSTTTTTTTRPTTTTTRPTTTTTRPTTTTTRPTTTTTRPTTTTTEATTTTTEATTTTTEATTTTTEATTTTEPTSSSSSPDPEIGPEAVRPGHASFRFVE